MADHAHFEALQNMYLSAPINELYRPTIEVTEAAATIEVEVSKQFFHSAGALHGSVYFKMLDDAAFFAANSLEPDVFVLTASFRVDLLRPVSGGTLRSVGRVVERVGSRFTAEAELFDASGASVATGSGVFVGSRILLCDAEGYSS